MTEITYVEFESEIGWQIDCPDEPMTWDEAMEYAKKQDIGWRLPTIQELFSIVDYEQHNPAINKGIFSGTNSSGYWSSTTLARNTSFAWYVVFYSGYVNSDYKTGKYYVRLVRDLNP